MPDIQVGDLVRHRRDGLERVHVPGVWLVTDRALWKALCAQGNKRMWLWLESLEKL